MKNKIREFQNKDDFKITKNEINIIRPSNTKHINGEENKFKITRNAMNIISQSNEMESEEDSEEETEKIIFPSNLSLEEINTITNQMTKGICFIEDEQNHKICTGFLCHIIYPTIKNFYCLMTSDEIINENYIKNKENILLCFNESNDMDSIKLNSNKIIHFNNKYGISIIEINKEDKISFVWFLKMESDLLKLYLNDDKSFEDFENNDFVYIPYFNQSKTALISLGKIEEIKNNEAIHFYNRYDNVNGLLGAPILNLEYKQIIGIYAKEKKENGKIIGVFFDLILKDLLEKYFKKKPKIVQVINKVKNANKLIQNYKNQITLKFNLQEDDIGQNIYILNSSFDYQNEELNEDNIELEINGEKTYFLNSFIPKQRENVVIIKFINEITNCYCMFYGCGKIEEIDLSKFKFKNVENMEKMFSFCYQLKRIDLSPLNTFNVKNMKYMFYMCKNLEYIKIKTLGNNKTQMGDIFSNCDNLKILDLTSFSPLIGFNIEYILKHMNKLEKIKLKKEDKNESNLKLLKDFRTLVEEV